MKLDAQRETRILTALRTGNTLKAAAAYAGIDEATLHRWRRRYAGFASQIEIAEAEAHVTVVARLMTAIQQGDVRAMMFWLERRRPEEWGIKQSAADAEAPTLRVTVVFDRGDDQLALPG